MARRTNEWTGIYKHYSRKGSKAWCYRAVVRGRRDQPTLRQCFPPDTSPTVMQKWRARARVSLSGA